MLAWFFQGIKKSCRQLLWCFLLPALIYIYFCLFPLQFLNSSNAVVVGAGTQLVSGLSCPSCLRFWMWLNGYHTKMQPGSYIITSHTTYSSLSKRIVKGLGDAGFIVIPEGATKNSVIQDIKNNEKIVETESMHKLLDMALLVPTTIRFAPGASDVSVVSKIVSYHNKVIANIAKNCPAKYHDQFEIVASIIQKESGYEPEYPFIAAVIYNRLKKHMRLQVDVEPDSYKKLGLPNKPIAAPGIAALKAACNPAVSDWLYYVSDGRKHIFSSNYNDHLQVVNRRKYVH